jgi:ferritin-like metal-binding protein YciE
MQASVQGGQQHDVLRDEFVTGLVNIHAVEKQAMQLINRQIERSQKYPEVEARLRRHLDETNAQHERLDKLLRQFDANPSMLKDFMMQASGNIAALMHAVSDDEILKNTFANAAFENFEAASYESLIAMAEAGGYSDALAPLRQSLQEERDMAQWVHDNVDMITRRYIELKSAGEKADR